MKIITFTGKEVQGPDDNNDYWRKRKHHDLYRLMVAITKALFPAAKSAIDVGCYTSGLIVEMDWIERRVASDIQKNLVENWKRAEEVEFVYGDAFQIQFSALFDLVISNQTVEHLENPAGFIRKLLLLGKGLIVSTTFETPYGLIPGHIQDPIDLDKFKSWFPVELDSYTVCYHPTNKKIGHIIGVVKDNHPNRWA